MVRYLLPPGPIFRVKKIHLLTNASPPQRHIGQEVIP